MLLKKCKFLTVFIILIITKVWKNLSKQNIRKFQLVLSVQYWYFPSKVNFSFFFHFQWVVACWKNVDPDRTLIFQPNANKSSRFLSWSAAVWVTSAERIFTNIRASVLLLMWRSCISVEKLSAPKTSGLKMQHCGSFELEIENWALLCEARVILLHHWNSLVNDTQCGKHRAARQAVLSRLTQVQRW